MLQEVRFKEEVERTWSTHDNHGSQTKRLAYKIEGLRRRLMVLRKHIRKERNKKRQEALTKIK